MVLGSSSIRSARPRSRPVSGCSRTAISSAGVARGPVVPRRVFTRTYSANRMIASSSESAATTPTVTATYGFTVGPVGSK